MREIFEKAEKSAPCVIYFDEIDSLCQKRESTEVSNSESDSYNKVA